MIRQNRKAEKKRLVELLSEMTYVAPKDYINRLDIDWCADYLLSHGAIMPPCKVGDTVFTMWYRPSSKEWFIQSSIVIGITFMKCEWFVETDDDPRLFGSLFKKEWFTDREAAEQALKEKTQ